MIARLFDRLIGWLVGDALDVDLTLDADEDAQC